MPEIRLILMNSAEDHHSWTRDQPLTEGRAPEDVASGLPHRGLSTPGSLFYPAHFYP